MADNKQAILQRAKFASDILLTGMLYDDEGQRLSPSHSQNNSNDFAIIFHRN